MNFLFAQTEKIISGTISCDKVLILGIEITNLVSEKSTVSDQNGRFSIVAKAEDMLVFTSINYEYKRKFLEQTDIDSNNLVINLTKKIEQLDQVIVEKNNQLDAVKLGILSKPAKEYTPAERRLKNAGELKPTALLTGLLGMSIPIEPIINAVSGHTKQMKNNLIVEHNELRLLKIKYLYNEDFYIQKLKIKSAAIKAFQYYAVDDKLLMDYLKLKNKSLIKLRMISLAIEFNNLQDVNVIEAKIEN